MSDYIDVTYGECLTFEKLEGDTDAETRGLNYMHSEPYASSISKMLDTLMLPPPDKILRGKFHDLLFLNSHGAVVKVGGTNIDDLVNPAILQPLMWLQDDGHQFNFDRFGLTNSVPLPLTVAVYGGMEHLINKDWGVVDEVESFLKQTDQLHHDVIFSNIGLANINEKQEAVLLDADNLCNRSKKDLIRKREVHSGHISRHFNNKADIIDVTMQELFGHLDIAKKMEVFYAHHPIRQKFGAAFKDKNNPDKDKLRAAWGMAADRTNNPKLIECSVIEVNRNKGGKARFVRKEKVVETVLHTSWITPIEEQRAALKMAV